MNKPSKYKNKKTIIDDIKFDSRKEAERYLLLKHRLEEGEIENLELQKKFELIPKQEYHKPDGTIEKYRACHYIADFFYIENGQKVVEDVKGYSCYKKGFTTETPEFKIKRKLFIQKYGEDIDFRVV